MAIQLPGLRTSLLFAGEIVSLFILFSDFDLLPGPDNDIWVPSIIAIVAAGGAGYFAWICGKRLVAGTRRRPFKTFPVILYYIVVGLIALGEIGPLIRIYNLHYPAR
jgi:hypothetical protein